ncbi:MAG: serine protease [Nitrososphaera sp.]|nr:serine protease [Nitrososphaera sp.]
MYAFEGTARPVLFEQPESEYPYWGKGTSFLLANSKHYFWITAEHVIRSMGGSAEALRIFPSDESRISLPFNEKYTIKKEGLDDEHKDIYALRIDLSAFQEGGDAPLTAQDAELGLMPAESLPVNAELWIIGYPSESRFVDYDARHIKCTRSVVRALYQGISTSDHCHTAKVETSLSLADYDGLSGSPVFFLQKKRVGAEDVLFPRIVGMLLRGTSASSVVHFVSARVIGRLLELASSDA